MFLVRMRVISEICEYQIKYKSFENSVEIFPYNRKLFYTDFINIRLAFFASLKLKM